ncbi:hypothetical protein Lal_00039183 [Lupinus albus]|nr:hypothetical protein Lal_00039183 [Lupinus albus]
MTRSPLPQRDLLGTRPENNDFEVVKHGVLEGIDRGRQARGPQFYNFEVVKHEGPQNYRFYKILGNRPENNDFELGTRPENNDFEVVKHGALGLKIMTLRSSSTGPSKSKIEAVKHGRPQSYNFEVIKHGGPQNYRFYIISHCIIE